MALEAGASAGTTLLISVPDQRMQVIQSGQKVAEYRVSTSKFGLGDVPRSYATPLGKFEICDKVGAGAPLGAVFKGLSRTGEVLRPNAKGRDPIVTRILRLRGLESRNARASDRGIYIHGTPEERTIGRPASFGCVRMKSSDVMELFRMVDVGTDVEILNTSLRSVRPAARSLGGELARNESTSRSRADSSGKKRTSRSLRADVTQPKRARRSGSGKDTGRRELATKPAVQQSDGGDKRTSAAQRTSGRRTAA